METILRTNPAQKWFVTITVGLLCMFVGCVRKSNESLSQNTKSPKSSSRTTRVADSDDKTGALKEEKKMDPIYERLRADRLTHAEFQSIRRTILKRVEKDPEQKKMLAKQMRQEPNPNLRIFLLQIIGDTRDGFYEADLCDVIATETDEKILQTAATMLGKLETPTNIAVLLKLLSHNSPNVRLGAVWGLKSVPSSPLVIKQLLGVLDDSDPVHCWWPSPRVGGYTVGKEAAAAIDALTKKPMKGNKALIQEWIVHHQE